MIIITNEDATEMLQGKIINLKRGFVGVLNRSQADINAKVLLMHLCVYSFEYNTNCNINFDFTFLSALG